MGPTTGTSTSLMHGFARPLVVATTVLAHRYGPCMAAQTVKRTKTRQLRLTPGEDSKIAEDAKAAGLEFSEFVRRECGIKNFGRSALRRRLSPSEVVQQPVNAVPRPAVSPDFDRRVSRHALRMPRRAAENLVRREDARERAA